MKHGRSVDSLGLLAACLVLLVVVGAIRAWGASILTEQVTVTATPGVVGVNTGRCWLEIGLASDAAASISCGPTNLAQAEWWTIPAGQSHAFGIVYKGQCTAEQPISCVSASGSITAYLSQEGGMPNATMTFTATSAATATHTPPGTDTPTVTRTPVKTATRTWTPTTTNTPTNTPTQSATATAT